MFRARLFLYQSFEHRAGFGARSLIYGKTDQLPWSAPVPCPTKKLVINGIKIHRVRYPFLASFLRDVRIVDIPPEQAHALLTFLLHTGEESCFRYVGLRSYVEFFDNLDLTQWIGRVNRVEVLPAFAIPWPSETDVEEIRHSALKRWPYDKRLIRRLVGIVARCGDDENIMRI